MKTGSQRYRLQMKATSTDSRTCSNAYAYTLSEAYKISECLRKEKARPCFNRRAFPIAYLCTSFTERRKQ